MLNLVNSIATNLLNANAYSRCTETALGVYAVAKAKGDTAMMDRALGYAGNATEGATKAAGKIDDDVREALKAARAEEKEKAQEEQKARDAKDAQEKRKIEDCTEISNNAGTDQVSQDQVVVDSASTESADQVSFTNYSNNGTSETPAQQATIDIKA